MSLFKKKRKSAAKQSKRASAPKIQKSKPEQWTPPFSSPDKRSVLKVYDTVTATGPEMLFIEVPKTKEEESIPRFEYNPPKILDGKNPKKEFLSVFQKLTCKYNRWNIWSDFVTMFACAISNTTDMGNKRKREDLYLSLIRKYDKEEQELFPELAAWTVLALEDNPEQDFLGSLFLELELNNEDNGQFFTPYNVCHMMASITLGDLMEQIKVKGYISVNDPCCGAGATLIAAANEAKTQLEKHNLNFQDYILVVGQDIDFTATMMCYIQISLLGVAGYLKVGNTITEPMAEGDSLENYWFTPMYNANPVWRCRRIFEQMDNLFKNGGNFDGKI